MKDLVNHPLQSIEWGEFRKKTGVKVTQGRNFQITIHKIPHTSRTIGYVPKGPLPNKEMISQLKRIGEEEKCVFIQLEPNVEKSKEPKNWKLEIARFAARRGNWKLRNAAHPLFTKYTFILDLTKSEEELLKGMHPKTRYNIKVALKNGVKILEDNSDEAFEIYLKLTAETTRRQGFYAHAQKYHRLMWEALRMQNSESRIKNLNKDKLTAHLLTAQYQPKTKDQGPKTLVAWILFVYKDTLYYPYGASSSLHRETMASNLMMWEVIKFGKKLGLEKFDMWGSLGPNPDKNDSWYGFHRFKEGYGGELVEFVGSFDLVINPVLYGLYKILDKVRWILLRIKK